MRRSLGAVLVLGGLAVAGLCAAPDALAQATGADLGITKTAPPLSYTSNSLVDYTVTVESNGPAAGTTVQVVDEIPDDMRMGSIVAPPGWNCVAPPSGGSGTITCTASSLAPGATATFTISLRVAMNVLPGVRITNTATVSSHVPDPLPNNDSSSFSFLVQGGSRDTVGIYDSPSGAFFLKNTNATGNADLAFVYGSGGAFKAIKGDWNSDGIDTVGIYDPATSTFFLKNTNSSGPADISFTFGAGGQGYVPLAGDWDADGVDTIGLYQPSTGLFFLRNSNSAGAADVTFTFGAGGGIYMPVVGDWDANGTDTVGVFQSSTGAFFLKNSNANGSADLTFVFGAPNLIPLSGDWDGDGLGRDTIGVYNPATAAFFLKNTNAAGPADITFNYGPTFSTPIMGDWNGL